MPCLAFEKMLNGTPCYVVVRVGTKKLQDHTRIRDCRNPGLQRAWKRPDGGVCCPGCAHACEVPLSPAVEHGQEIMILSWRAR